MRFLKTTLLAAAVAVTAALVVRPSNAQDGKDGKDEKPEEPKVTEAEAKALRAVDDLATAGQMIELGRRTKNPEALIAAALVLHRTPAEEAQHKLDTVPAEDEKKALLDEAAKMRPQDKALQASVTAAREQLAAKERGAVGGAKTYTGWRIAAGKSDFGNHAFTGSSKVSLRVTATQPAFKPKGLYLVDPSFAKLEIIDGHQKVVASQPYIPLGGTGTVTWNAPAKATGYFFRVTNVSPPGVGQPKGVDIICTLSHN